MYHGDFLDRSLWIDSAPPLFDITYVIGTLNVDYGMYNGNLFTYFEQVLNQATATTAHATVFIMLQDTGGIDQYRSLPIPNVTDLLLQQRRPFVVDYSRMLGVYKLTVYSQQF
jgi:hypothetical protein